MRLSEKAYRNNFLSFLWHGAFLALTVSFVEVNTIIPSMLIKMGGTPFLLGLLTTIMLGGASIAQLLFAGLLLNSTRKKKFLLLGINLRIIALFGLAFLFYTTTRVNNNTVILLIFLLISLFSFSGAFANISYTDLLGKTVKKESRKTFFTSKQIINSVGMLSSALIVRELLKMYEFPHNYGLLFVIAGGLLLIASLGFWKIIEKETIISEHKRFFTFIKRIPSEIKKNPNLKQYLFITNTLGVGMSIPPFLILFAKEQFTLSAAFVGNLLFFITTGMLLAGLFLFKHAKRFTYKQLLFISLTLTTSTLLVAALTQNSARAYQLIFIISGMFIATYKVAIGGFLLEISNNENRIAYAGIAGAGSMLPLLSPLLAGAFIPNIGYTITFMIVVGIIIASYYFIKQIECKVQE